MPPGVQHVQDPVEYQPVSDRLAAGRRVDHRRWFWEAIARGDTSVEAAAFAGVSGPVGVRWFREGGGMATVGVDPVGVDSQAAGIDWSSGSFQVCATSAGVR